MTAPFPPGNRDTGRHRRVDRPVPPRNRWPVALAVAVVAVAVVALGSWWATSPAGRDGARPSGSPSSAAAPPPAAADPSTTAPTVATPTTLPSPVTGAHAPTVSSRSPTVVRPSPSGPVSATGPTTVQAPAAAAPEQASVSYASTAPEPPATDVAATPDLTVACRAAAAATCLDAALQAFDNARASEGIGPLTLPSDFESLTAGEQLLVLVDCERVDRGLTPVAGELDALDGLAMVGAADDADPSFPSSGLTDVTAWAWTGNWASAPSVLSAVYEWMYDDGPGSGNIDCTLADPAGCWDHRDNILGFQNDVDDYGGSLSFGGAVVEQGSAHGSPTLSVTTLTTWSPDPTSGYTYTWADAVAAGAA